MCFAKRHMMLDIVFVFCDLDLFKNVSQVFFPVCQTSIAIPRKHFEPKLLFTSQVFVSRKRKISLRDEIVCACGLFFLRGDAKKKNLVLKCEFINFIAFVSKFPSHIPQV